MKRPTLNKNEPYVALHFQTIYLHVLFCLYIIIMQLPLSNISFTQVLTFCKDCYPIMASLNKFIKPLKCLYCVFIALNCLFLNYIKTGFGILSRLFRHWVLSLWGWYFFHVDPGHWVPTRLRVSRSVTNAVTDPESHTHDPLVDFLTHSFDLSHAVQILFGAISMYHVDYTINLRWSWALSTIEGEIPSSAATMAIIDTKSTIPKDAQASFVGRFVENTFLHKINKMITISNQKKNEFGKGGNNKNDMNCLLVDLNMSGSQKLCNFFSSFVMLFCFNFYTTCFWFLYSSCFFNNRNLNLI